LKPAKDINQCLLALLYLLRLRVCFDIPPIFVPRGTAGVDHLNRKDDVGSACNFFFRDGQSAPLDLGGGGDIDRIGDLSQAGNIRLRDGDLGRKGDLSQAGNIRVFFNDSGVAGVRCVVDDGLLELTSDAILEVNGTL
jgi:hypothetical protein